ncbi:hypothetical protein OENI_40103 [Oenococcus oeni]|nr:hypothetical protein OENI_40103 [Oenococcus oeni]
MNYVEHRLNIVLTLLSEPLFYLGFQISVLKDGFSTFDNEILTAKQINQYHLYIGRELLQKLLKSKFYFNKKESI